MCFPSRQLICPSGKPATPIEDSAERANVPDQLIRVFEPAVGLDEFARACRRVSPQREDVLDAELSRVLEHRGRLRDGRVDAGEVRHRGQPVLALDTVDDAERFFAGAAARAVGDRAEVRLQGAQLWDGCFEENSLALVRFRREKLERDDGPADVPGARKDVADELYQGTKEIYTGLNERGSRLRA